jgi:hypothetical protein
MLMQSLQSCPHPTLYSTYIKYLQPLLQPWAASTVRPEQEQAATAKEVAVAPSEAAPSSQDSEAELSDDTVEMSVRTGAQAPLFGLSTSDETLWDDDFYDMDDDDDVIDHDSFFDEPLDDVFLQDDSDSFSEEEDSSESVPRPQARETWKTSTKRT